MHKPSALLISLATGLTVALVPAVPATASDGEVFLTSATAIDRRAGTVTLPLHRGAGPDGRTVWYVVTEASDRDVAERLGVNESSRLENALGTRAVQRGRYAGRVLHFSGTVDFAPERVVVPGEQGFPPSRFAPGAVGDARYSPLVTSDGRSVLNATHVANATGRHDAVVALDTVHRRVTLDTFNGFYEDDRVQYLHQEASDPLVAAIEGSTYAPNLNAAPGLAGRDDDRSARQPILPVVNGPRAGDPAGRQGLESALLGQGDPLNIVTELPDDGDYSPLWDVHPAAWTPHAISSGQRERVESEDEFADLVEDGLLISAGTGPRNADLEGLRALPGISNCPIVLELG